jgi:hypothetical protein
MRGRVGFAVGKRSASGIEPALPSVVKARAAHAFMRRVNAGIFALGSSGLPPACGAAPGQRPPGQSPDALLKSFNKPPHSANRSPRRFAP